MLFNIDSGHEGAINAKWKQMDIACFKNDLKTVIKVLWKLLRISLIKRCPPSDFIVLYIELPDKASEMVSKLSADKFKCLLSLNQAYCEIEFV